MHAAQNFGYQTNKVSMPTAKSSILFLKRCNEQTSEAHQTISAGGSKEDSIKIKLKLIRTEGTVFVRNSSVFCAWVSKEKKRWLICIACINNLHSSNSLPMGKKKKKFRKHPRQKNPRLKSEKR